MKHYVISVIEIGRNKYSRTFKYQANNFEEVEDRILAECSPHLLSKNISITLVKRGEYIVNAGFHTVGKVTVKIIAMGELKSQ